MNAPKHILPTTVVGNRCAGAMEGAFRGTVQAASIKKRTVAARMEDVEARRHWPPACGSQLLTNFNYALTLDQVARTTRSLAVGVCPRHNPLCTRTA